MCGICGIAYSDVTRAVDHGVVSSMCEMIAHRGPDGSGTKSWPGVAFGHHRLSIIDLEGGAQPLANEDESIWITYNGELYNSPELRRYLLAKGHQFRTKSDTEVVVHAYEEFGLDFVTRLNGMFAFALYDLPRRRVVLVRDHFGIKPLYYAVDESQLTFGSTIRSVLAGLGRPFQLRTESLQEYLVFRYVTDCQTFDRQVRRLPPAHLAVWEQGRLTIKQYWEMPEPESGASGASPEVVSEFGKHLHEATRRQLLSDVPVGTFCSGGLDSGLVTAFAADASSDPLQTFVIGFNELDWDESELAADTADRFDTVHSAVQFGVADFAAHLERLAWFNDEPLSHPNSVPLYVLSGFARERVKVVLTGEGSDEQFCGYPRYHIAKLRGQLEGLPGWALSWLGRAVGLLPGHRAAKLADGLPLSSRDVVLYNSAYVSPKTVQALTGGSLEGALAPRRALIGECEVEGDAVATLSRYEMLTYLGCALDRMDRVSMAHGLEARVPFLDVELVEWGARLPTRARIGGRENKRIVRDLARSVLGPSLLSAPKSGFGLPLADWFRATPMQPVVSRLLDPDHPAAAFVAAAVVRKMVQEHSSGLSDHGEALWLLSSFYLWCETL